MAQEGEIDVMGLIKIALILFILVTLWPVIT